MELQNQIISGSSFSSKISFQEFMIVVVEVVSKKTFVFSNNWKNLIVLFTF